MKYRKLFSSESVSMGHPDKMSDQISDALLDAYLEQDPDARVAIETLVATGMVIVAGQVTANARVDIQDVVRQTVREIGYHDPAMGFDADGCAVLVSIDKQSPDISQGVTEGLGIDQEMGAGDQGMMFGYATDETPELMPLPIMLARELLARLAELREKHELFYLRPDAKSQVTVEYENAIPKRVHTVVLSTQHHPDVSYEQLKTDMIEKVIKTVIPNQYLDSKTIYHINPTGRFVVGGPHGDTGLTGRKIIVDTYGGWARHGGGAFSGKDPSKVDRSAHYAARYIAKNIVAAGLAHRCEVQIAYAIGVSRPVSILVDCFGTEKISEEKIAELVDKHFDLRPKQIIEHLKLKRPIYKPTARYGHFGINSPDYTWEKTDKAEILCREAGLGNKKAIKTDVSA